MTQTRQTILETARLKITHWLPHDWLAVKPLATDPRVLKYIGDSKPWPDERIQAFVNGGIERSKDRGWILWPVIHKADAKLIGSCGFNAGFAPDVEIGWRFLPEYWGKGLATEAARAVLDHGFRTWNFPRVISVAQPANTASIRIMQKLGMTFDRAFVHDGKDVVRYVIDSPRSSP